MNKIDLVKNYRIRLSYAKDKKQELEKIIEEINNLEYSANNTEISKQDKLKILESLQQSELIESKMIFAQSNKEYLELLQTTIKALGGK